MVVCGLKVIVRHTFLQVHDVSQKGARQRACSDSCVCQEDDESTVADSDSLSVAARGQWGCADLDLDLDLDSDTSTQLPDSPNIVMSSPAEMSSLAPLTPPGVFASSKPLLHSLVPSPIKSPHHNCQDHRTTLMLRNLPSSFTQFRLLDVLDATGFCGKYDFVYLPVDFQSGAGLGYAFVNMCSAVDAQRAMLNLSGFSSWGDAACRKVLEVCWSDPHQGLEMLIDRYRNSRVMHRSVPEQYKPLLFDNGNKIPFPTPTKRVRSPL